MIMGVILVLLGLVLEPLAMVFSWFVWLFLSYFILVVEVFGSFSWGMIKIESLSFAWAVWLLFSFRLSNLA